MLDLGLSGSDCQALIYSQVGYLKPLHTGLVYLSLFLTLIIIILYIHYWGVNK